MCRVVMYDAATWRLTHKKPGRKVEKCRKANGEKNAGYKMERQEASHHGLGNRQRLNIFWRLPRKKIVLKTALVLYRAVQSYRCSLIVTYPSSLPSIPVCGIMLSLVNFILLWFCISHFLYNQPLPVYSLLCQLPSFHRTIC